MGYIKRERYIRVIGIFSTLAFILLFIYTFTPIYFRTDSAEGVATNPPEPTITITSGHNTASLDLVVNSGNGTFATSSLNNSAQFSVATTNASGYTLTITGDGTGKLSNSTTGGFFNTITSAIDENTFSGNDATLYNGMWGILPSRYNSETNTYYRPAPTTSSPSTLDEGPSGTTNYTLGIGARTDYLLASGTYDNTFTLTATAKPAPYTINYLDNSSGTATPLLPADSGDSLTSEIELDDTTPTKTGYTFGGWCDVATTADANGSTTCPSGATTYQPGDDVDFIDFTTSTNVLNLYAIWSINTYNVTVNFAGQGVSSVTFTATGQTTRTVSTSGGTANLVYGVPYTMTMNLSTGNYEFVSWALNSSSYGTLSSTSTNPATFTTNTSSASAIITATAKTSLPPESLQEITASTCTTTPKQVYDSRDNQIYWIQKLADGRCWMMDNLNLGAVPLLTDLTSANSNLQDTITVTEFESWETTTGTNSETNGEFIPISGIDSTSESLYGTLYNYCAISGGDPRACVVDMTTQITISYDICPAGWRLPTGGSTSSSEFKILTNNSNYNTVGKLRAPISSGGAAFSLPGRFLKNGPELKDTFGYYWSSTRWGDSYMYGLGINTSEFWLENTSYRKSGLSARCILDNTTISDITTMQQLGSSNNAAKRSVINSMVTGTSYPITDTRDNQSYTIAKLGDGNVWMTKNLAIGCDGSSVRSRALTNTDSNINITHWDTPTALLSNSDYSSSTSGYTTPAIMCSNNSDYGAWYNFAAASAGTIADSSYSGGNDVYNICPKSWTLPTINQAKGIKDVENTAKFLPVDGGWYLRGVPDRTEYGRWWTSERSGSVNWYYFSKNTGSSGMPDPYFTYRYLGLYIRCILKQ